MVIWDLHVATIEEIELLNSSVAMNIATNDKLSGRGNWSSGIRLWSGRSEAQILSRSKRIQCCQRLATAARFLQNEL